MSGTKRRVEELGGHVFSAAVGDVVARAMSAAVVRYEAHSSVDDQLERLVMVHSAVDEAERVHIASCWLRRWLWRLRDAALEADEVLRLFRQLRATEETDASGSRQPAGRKTLWSAAKLALRSAKNLLRFSRDDGNGNERRLSHMVTRLEREALGLGDFLKMLELEIRRSLPVQAGPPPPVHTSPPPPASHEDYDDLELAVPPQPRRSSHYPPPRRGSSLSPPPRVATGSKAGEEKDGAVFWMSLELVDKHSFGWDSASPDGGDGSRSDHHGLSWIPHEEYVAGVRKMGLRIVRQRIRRALGRLLLLMRKPPPEAPPAVSHSPIPPDTDRLRDLVARIRRALGGTSGSAGTGVEFHGDRCWLALWRAELQAVADNAERVLLAPVPVDDDAGGDVMATPRDAGDDGLMRNQRRRTAQSVETAAAHLKDFVALTGFALTPLRRSPSWPGS